MLEQTWTRDPVTGHKVLFVTTSAHDYEAAGGRTRILAEARVLRERGYEVNLLCLVPLKKWFRPLSLLENRNRLECDFGGTVYMSILAPRRFVPLWASLWWNGGIILLTSLWVGSNVVHGHGPGAAAAAIQARKIRRSLKVVCDFHGASLEEYKERGGGAGDLHGRRIRALEKVCSESDAVVVVSRYLAAYLAEHVAIQFATAVVVPCATDVVHLDFRHREMMRARLGLSRRFVFVYAGSHRFYQRVDRMLQLFLKVLERRRDAYLLVLTNHLKEFETDFLHHGVPAWSYRVASATRNELPGVLQAADCGILLRDASLVNRVASPTKFAEYLAAGLPVLAEGEIGDYNQLIRETGVGELIDGNDELEQILSFMELVGKNRIWYWHRCRAVCEERLSWSEAGKHLTRLYERLLQ